jgi:hypothetical protein
MHNCARWCEGDFVQDVGKDYVVVDDGGGPVARSCYNVDEVSGAGCI